MAHKLALYLCFGNKLSMSMSMYANTIRIRIQTKIYSDKISKTIKLENISDQKTLCKVCLLKPRQRTFSFLIFSILGVQSWLAWIWIHTVCFWASWIRIRIHWSEVWIRILLSPSKNSKKNLDSYCFVTSFWLFFFEKWCKCTFKK